MTRHPKCFALAGVLASCAVAAVLICPAPAAARVYEYDFNALDPDYNPCHGFSGYLHGQDNWTTWLRAGVNTSDEAPLVKPAPWYGAPAPGDGYCITHQASVGVSSDPIQPNNAWRVNDSNWSFNLGNDVEHPTQPGVMLTNTAVLAQHFALQVSMAIDGVCDYDFWTIDGFGQFGIQNTNTGKEILFGLEVLPWYYCVSLWDAGGTAHRGGHPRPTQEGGRNTVWDFRLMVDTDANGGEGAGSLYAMERGVHTDWQEVEDLQDINLKLVTNGMDVLNANQLRMGLANHLVAMDNLQVITPDRGDANLDYIVDGQDFTYLKANFGSSGMTWQDADFNNDGMVDGQDFTWLKANFGNNQRHTQPGGASGAAIPEPTTIVLLAGPLGWLILKRRKP